MGYTKSIGGRLRGWKKAKWGSLWDWTTSRMERYTSFTLLGTGQLTQRIEMVLGKQGNNEGFCGLLLWGETVP